MSQCYIAALNVVHFKGGLTVILAKHSRYGLYVAGAGTGEELDARSDLFSFGAVLYEMTSGQMAFLGNTAAIVLYIKRF